MLYLRMGEVDWKQPGDPPPHNMQGQPRAIWAARQGCEPVVHGKLQQEAGAQRRWAGAGPALHHLR